MVRESLVLNKAREGARTRGLGLHSNFIVGYSAVKIPEIRNDHDFYQTVHAYTRKSWQWGIGVDEDIDGDDCEEPTPDEMIRILQSRIEWVKSYSASIDKYLQRRNGPKWFRVVEGSRKK